MTQPRHLDPTAAAELKRLLARYGVGLAGEPARLGALLRDLAGQHRLEISLLVAAAESGVASELVAERAQALPAARLATLARRLEEDRGLSAPNARWAVEAWSAAASPAAGASGGKALDSNPAPPPPPWSRVSAVQAPSEPSVMGWPPAESSDASPRGRLVWLAAALVTLAAIAVLIAVILSGNGPPPSPSRISVRATDVRPDGAAVSVSWDADEGSDVTYELRRDGKTIASTASSPYVDNALDWGTSYTYEVRARSADRLSPPISGTVEVGTPPIDTAWLAGSYDTEQIITDSEEKADIGYKFNSTWTFIPSCSYPDPCSVVVKDSATKLSTPLRREGGTFSATTEADFGTTCEGSHISSRLVITLSTDSAHEVGGEWVVDRFSGTLRESFPGTQCHGGFYEWDLSGS